MSASAFLPFDQDIDCELDFNILSQGWDVLPLARGRGRSDSAQRRGQLRSRSRSSAGSHSTSFIAPEVRSFGCDVCKEDRPIDYLYEDVGICHYCYDDTEAPPYLEQMVYCRTANYAVPKYDTVDEHGTHDTCNNC
jgi:hypothetical protein